MAFPDKEVCTRVGGFEAAEPTGSAKQGELVAFRDIRFLSVKAAKREEKGGRVNDAKYHLCVPSDHEMASNRFSSAVSAISTFAVPPPCEVARPPCQENYVSPFLVVPRGAAQTRPASLFFSRRDLPMVRW
jgi:hypothetical protein